MLPTTTRPAAPIAGRRDGDQEESEMKVMEDKVPWFRWRHGILTYAVILDVRLCYLAGCYGWMTRSSRYGLKPGVPFYVAKVTF
jgi:hypothetical protein